MLRSAQRAARASFESFIACPFAAPQPFCASTAAFQMPSTTEPAAAQGKLAALLGPELLNKSGVVSTSSLTVKFIGLYFSASWCPPCRAFTPKLAQFYAEFKARHAAADDFDIVFVSSDKTPVAAEDYYEGMPWLMMPFEDRSRKEGLTRKCQVLFTDLS